jgi:hypothetical protein
MSLDVDLMVVQPTSVYSANITHNLGKMASEVKLSNGMTLYDILWRPDEQKGLKCAKDIAGLLDEGWNILLSNPEKFKKFEPDNGWGSYHVLYRVECTDTGDSYIGVTVAQGQAFLRSVKVRWQKHVSRAKCENKNWAFCEFLRSNTDADFRYEVLEVVRGRKPAHQRERQLIAEYEPTLNTF